MAAVDHQPRRLGGAGARDDVLGGVDELLVAVPVAPVPLRDAPVVARMLLQRLQALLLRVSVEMHPELEDQGAVVGERPLERRDAREAPVERRLADAPVGAVHQRRGIPGAEEEPEAPALRQVAPVAPELGPLAFLLGQPVVGVGDDPARVQPLGEQVDRLALAPAVDSGEQHDRGKVRVRERALGLDQRDPERGPLLLERGLGELPRPLALHLLEYPTAHRRPRRARTAENRITPPPSLRQRFSVSRGCPPSRRRAGRRGPAGGRGRRVFSGAPRRPGGGPAPR